MHIYMDQKDTKTIGNPVLSTDSELFLPVLYTDKQLIPIYEYVKN